MSRLHFLLVAATIPTAVFLVACAPTAPPPAPAATVPPPVAPPPVVTRERWLFRGLLADDQLIRGGEQFQVLFENDRPICYFTFTDDRWHGRRTIVSRPVTIERGVIATRFTADFAPDTLEQFEEFTLNDVVEITITASQLTESVFDATVKARYVF